MKIGIFVSSQIRDRKRLEQNFDFLEGGFRNAELVFGVYDYQYDDFKYILDKYENVKLLKEPEIHYEPYIDNPNWSDNYQYTKKLKNPNPRHKHQTKQILCHNELMKTYGEKYDIIVRSRYDTTICPAFDFTEYAKIMYEADAPMSICTRSDYEPATSIFNIYKESTWYNPLMHHGMEEVRAIPKAPMMLDNGILIHRTEHWDCDLVDRLHKNKKLLAAEFGWYQVLIEKRKRFLHYDGGASISRSVLISDRKRIEKIL
jgi:hypothetical protein